MSIQQTVISAFAERFGESPTYLVRAPGRVNLIGEHTDYNDGFVLPMAIDRAVWIALRPSANRTVKIHSLDFPEMISFSLDNYSKQTSSPAEYVKGIAWALQGAGYELKAWEAVMKGDVPIGAGLSSSAALELAVAKAFSVLGGFEWDSTEMALLAQKAENKWVGVNSGIMDQMISASGKEGHALLIDCRSLDTEKLPLPQNTAIVVLDTGTRRELVTSAYNERREQCEKAARHFGVAKLRDVSLEQFESGKSDLDDVTMRRARHVVSENARVLEAREAMLKNDALRLGQLFNASHASLRDDFEVTNDALNIIVAIAQAQTSCFGARMTGAGFGGCAVALVDSEQVSDFTAQVEQAYSKQTAYQPAIYVCQASNGAEVVL
jgi:galactokinase